MPFLYSPSIHEKPINKFVEFVFNCPMLKDLLKSYNPKLLIVRPNVDKAGLVQANGVHKGIHDAHHVVRGDHLVQRVGEEAELSAVVSGAVCHA